MIKRITSVHTHRYIRSETLSLHLIYSSQLFRLCFAGPRLSKQGCDSHQINYVALSHSMLGICDCALAEALT